MTLGYARVMAGEELLKLRELFYPLAAGRGEVEKVYDAAVQIFEGLVKKLEVASLEEKERILLEMQEMGLLVTQESDLLNDKLNLSEEELSSLLQDPNQFREEHWALLISTKQRLNELVQSAAKALKSSILVDKHPSHKPPTGKRPPRRSDWMKS
jgi:hypothetical protein